jgi:hypothetical protein
MSEATCGNAHSNFAKPRISLRSSGLRLLRYSALVIALRGWRAFSTIFSADAGQYSTKHQQNQS